MTTVDPDVRIILDEVPLDLPVARQTPAELRAWMRSAFRVFEGPGFCPERVDRIVDRVIRGEAGEIPVRVYSRDDTPPTALIVYLHGGGWVAGDLETHDKVTRRLCVATGAVVVSVDYRLSPEHPFPAGFQDCWDSLLWASETYPGLPRLIAGDSAGGTLAGCVAMRARDEGGPHLAGQVLVYPAIDDDIDTETMHLYAGTYAGTREDFATYFGWYLNREQDRSEPYAMPGFAASLEGLPPTVIATAGLDPLLAAEVEHAERLRAAGVPVVLQRHPTLVHGWLDFFPRVPAAQAALDQLILAIRDLIAQPHPTPSTATPPPVPCSPSRRRTR